MSELVYPNNNTSNSVLIVDDNSADRELFSHYIGTEYANSPDDIVVVDSCELALSVIQSYTPSCCLVDYWLPNKNGLEFLKEIRQHERSKYIPVIMMTGEGDEAIAAEVMRSGAQDYLIKSHITAERLNKSIEAAIRACDVQRQLQYLAHYDTLTGLLSRALFMDRLQISLDKCDRYQHTCSLLYVDVDNFKHINDRYGHHVGDLALQIISARIKESCRGTDSAARLGGDEFAILLERIDEANTSLIAEKILAVVSQPLSLAGRKVKLTLSIGITHYSGISYSITEFLKQADEAMYYAKKSGKASYAWFSEKQNGEWERRYQLESMLPASIRENALDLVYQPIIDANNHALFGIEVLTRWNPHGYSIAANELVSMIERLGLFDTFHSWLIDAAFSQYKKWQNSTQNIKLCVNIPVHHSYNDGLLQSLQKSIDTYSIDPESVLLEIAEADLMSQPEMSAQLLESLTQKGFKISVDDFGSGYSSLPSLIKFPLHTLKVDKQLIQAMVASTQDQKVVETIVSLGHSLELAIVAEGVETQKQLSLAKKIGCDLLQGYYLAPPCTAQEIGDKFIVAPSVPK